PRRRGRLRGGAACGGRGGRRPARRGGEGVRRAGARARAPRARAGPACPRAGTGQGTTRYPGQPDRCGGTVVYPLDAILIGREEAWLPHVRRELLNVSAHLEAEFRLASEAIEALRRSRAEKRLILYLVESSSDMEALGRLAAILSGWPIVALMAG